MSIGERPRWFGRSWKDYTAPPALDLAAPAMVPAGAEQARLLAFACWLIAQWEVQVI